MRSLLIDGGVNQIGKFFEGVCNLFFGFVLYYWEYYNGIYLYIGSFYIRSENILIRNLVISNPTETDVKSAYLVFEVSIRDAFEKEGLGALEEDINREILNKKHMLDASLNLPDSGTYFLIAKLGDTVVGTISFGACGEDIRRCTDNQLQDIGELGSLYILPEYQGQGIGSALIKAMAAQLDKQGIERFCLDSGYKRAQKRWIRKFGTPCKIVEDYWGPGSSHMIWLCNVADFILDNTK
ncbi:MAG: acetyltransferase [Clostridia bacterium]|nr:acetyltransferase [Clostridia bacterium]